MASMMTLGLLRSRVRSRTVVWCESAPGAPRLVPFTPWRWCFAGGALFSFAWLLATAAFGLYVANFATYSNTYGALGGVIVLMLWFYLSAIVLVGAAGLMAAAMKVLQPELFAADQGLQPAPPATVAAAAPAHRPELVRPQTGPIERRVAFAAPDEQRRVSLALSGAVVVAGLAVGAIAARLIDRDRP